MGNIPVFDTVKEAVAATGAECSVLFVPAAFAPKAIREAADNEVTLIGPEATTLSSIAPSVIHWRIMLMLVCDSAPAGGMMPPPEALPSSF